MNIRTSQSQEEPRLLRRPASGRILGGVAAGLARHFALDVAHVRIILVALSFLGGAAVPLYLAAWVLIPAEGSGIAIADEVLNHAGSHLSGPASALFSQRQTEPNGFGVFRNVLL
jgi:phage shock protein PspC (stress-responsive transcriptional regulator)